MPSGAWYAALALAALVALRHPAFRWLVFGIAGFCWTTLGAEQRLTDRLPPEQHGADFALSGWIDAFPDAGSEQTVFSFTVDSPRARGFPKRLRLTWYDPPFALAPGTTLAVVARLRPPRGLQNPSGFDYERWLLQGGYGATGYVRSGERRADGAPSVRRSWLRLRARIAARLDALAPDPDASALVTALAIGERFRFTEQHWSDFRATGLSHLVAVSGMHVGLLGLIVFVVVRRVCLRLPSVLAAYDLPAAALASAAATAGYAALTGFAVPAQRSLLMIAVALAILVSRRRVALWQGLGAALLLVLLVDPFAPLSASFWLSFGAVAVLLLLAAPRTVGRDHAPRFGRRARDATRALIALQWSISLALLPLTAGFFAEVSIVAPLANLVAIPFFNLLLVPLTVLATLLLGIDALAPAIVHAAGFLAGAALNAIHAVAALDFVARPLAQPAPWAVVLACCGVALAAAGAFLPARRLAWLALLPLVFPAPTRLALGEATVTVLDVGHGLAVLVDTRGHRLMFDAGPRYPSGFDTGERVGLPALGSGGRRRLDRLIVSHADADHAGGAASIVRAFARADLLVGPDVDSLRGRRCERGQAWSWDGVDFAILHPPRGFAARGNESSCVLKVTARSGAVLITGDIEERGENALRRAAAADVVVVPHHGSATSSSAAFVAATGARLAIVSAAHANRWGFPRPEVRRRWQQHGAAVVVTGDSGAVTVALGLDGIAVAAERERRRRYWHAIREPFDGSRIFPGESDYSAL